MHALIIEDDPVIAMLLEDELRDLGYSSFATATTESEAIEAVAARCPNLITSDGSLLGGNGPNAVRSIRADFQVPVIFITGDPAHARQCFPSAPILEKPFTSGELARAVQQACC